MGTSQSSGGPGGGVPMVPPWTPAPPPGGPDPQPDGDGANPDAPEAPPEAAPAAAPAPQPAPLAPPGRFLGVRRNIGEFARTGDQRALQRSLGQYARTGYGGSGTATRRMGGTAATAGALASALGGLAAGGPPISGVDAASLAGKNAGEVMDALVEAVRPVDGTQDAEAERASIRDALSELLTTHPNADLVNLSPEERAFAVERFTASDVFRRFDLDVGKALRDSAPSATTALARLKEVRDYIRETVASSFRKLQQAGHSLTTGRVSQIVRAALRETFVVFEGYGE